MNPAVSFPRLTFVELRKMVDTRAGFWLQVATAAITVIAVIVRIVVGDAADHTFAAVLTVGIQPAAVLLPIAGVLLVTSEWSQRTGMITFALVPVRSRVLSAKLVASIVLALATLVMSVAVVAAGVLIASPGIDGTWSDATTLVPMQVASVAPMRLPVPRTMPRIPAAIFCSRPVTSMTPPNIIAERISHTVFSMLAMPPRLSNSSRAALPDSSL